MRLNKFIAQNFPKLSRRKADEMVSKSQVKINDQTALLGDQVENGDKVEIFNQGKWQILTLEETKSIVFYKPIFCLTTKHDPQRRKTIYDFLPPKYENLKPAGRLDYMSEGILVLSSDGDFIQELTHPSGEKTKTYFVQLNSTLTTSDIELLKKGLVIDEYRLKPMIVKAASAKDLQNYKFLNLSSKNNNKPWYVFELQEGRNNQIRKTMAIMHKKVLRLVRVQQGKYQLTQELYNLKYMEI